ncbi:MAG: DUF2752 domain-containing protein [Deltaproteobacteria bacterium]|nr:DUF2752 domain-containing protein [Deltaproteobacteria bacterium]
MNRTWTIRFLPILLLLTSIVFARAITREMGSTDEVVQLMPLRCPFRVLTGIPCPLCGIGHALVEAWTGRWQSSITHHPFGIATLLLCCFFSIVYLIRPNNVKHEISRLKLAFITHPRLPIAAAAVFLVIGFIRAFYYLW